MKRTRTWMVRAILIGVLICVSLCLGMGAAQPPNRRVPPAMRRPMNVPGPDQSAIMRLPIQTGISMADTSSQVRELTDFLLTPALLVQEAVSDGVVLTYPEE